MPHMPELQVKVRVTTRRELENRLCEQAENARKEYETAEGKDKAAAKKRYLTALQKLSAIPADRRNRPSGNS